MFGPLKGHDRGGVYEYIQVQQILSKTGMNSWMQNYQLQLLKMFKFKSVGILQFRILFSTADKHIFQYEQAET
jgi:hypothetical protein